MKKNAFILMSSVLALSVALAGCGSANNAATGDQNKESQADTGDKAQLLRANLHSEPPTADPGLAEDSTSGAVIRATFDGLTRLNAEGKPVESVAEKIEISDDLKTYTFHLRDSQWSNGDPVTAHDFEFAWKRVLNPATASNYAYQLYYIKNGEKYNKKQEGITADDVGVKAIDEKTLQVELENPTPYFLELTAFYSYMPVNKKVVEANPKWANEAATHVGNGPFKMENWEHKNKMTLVKNDKYWDKNAVKLDRIEFSMIEDENTELSMFLNDELDWAGKPLGLLPLDAIPPMKDEGKLHVKEIAGVYWYKFNTEQAPFNNAKIRKAFSYAIDRQSIVDNVTQAGEVPALGALPGSMAVNPGGLFKDHDVETAKKLLAEGMQELGISELPPITLSYNTADNHQKIAQAIQDQWKQSLGVDVQLKNTEWKVYIEDLHEGNYQVGRMGWLGDFNDPINFLELFKDKYGGNNDTRWENARFKELLEKSQTETDPAERKKLLAQAEQIFIDEMPVAPIYFYTHAWVQNEDVKDVVIDGLGFIDFKWASIQ
ncbi:peptide ABC transporter substrate-binding protein [Brevibacillus humidisoli]|uniref:peptide ABC transporter substrate-binding protein n=1 Tax=Brevibacillus humidisoli TaxID=2895522 RepID=UPI001E5D7ED6|nr:peptide ABC transporter substrate-binding protein [Brevibacillus humidisoli]UFJ40923.1 peptide ABC transporter substrate-binding protein [Brevibacillus humidisoli]